MGGSCVVCEVCLGDGDFVSPTFTYSDFRIENKIPHANFENLRSDYFSTLSEF